MKPKIVVTMPVPEEVMAELRTFADVDLRDSDSPIEPGELKERIADKVAVVSMLSDKIDMDVIDAAPKLKVIGNYGVGTNNVDLKYAAERGITVLNTPDVLTETTADLAWALMMAVARRIVEGDKFTREGRFKGWAPTLMMGADIFGKTLGIVGMGRIGRAIARRAAGFDMKTLYYKRNRLDLREEATLFATYADMDTLVEESDYIVLIAPLTPETRHMMNRERIRAMKRSACLINVGRGPLVDEGALVEALKEKKIAGAGLDVYENEPLLSPGIRELENVVILPHIGSATVETRTKMGMMIASGIRDVLDGRIPPNVVRY